jgi:NADPH:quinone reductase-like Zn-dependent oxidoreductase
MPEFHRAMTQHYQKAYEQKNTALVARRTGRYALSHAIPASAMILDPINLPSTGRTATALPSHMRAYRLTHFGAEHLNLAELPVPHPGPGEILVRWHAWSLNYRDLVIIDGTYLPDLPRPFTPVSDAAGVVTAVGTGVTQWAPGDRVVSLYVQSWDTGRPTPDRIGTVLGGPLPGVLAEYSVLPAGGVLAIPPHLSFAAAATLPVAAVTAWNVLFTHGDVQPGDTVVIEGTGGVSIFALQLAHAAGLRTIVTSSQDAKLHRAQLLGADDTINYRRHPNWSAEVRRLTGGMGARVVLDVGGAATLPQALRAVAIGGRVPVIGFLSGTSVNLDVPALVRSLATVHGVRVGSREMAGDLLHFLAHKRDLQPVIDCTFPFATAPAALAHLRAGAAFGKVVIIQD